jgi:uncharacterized hydrophobic protein (TIGR00271 family)
MSICGFVPNPDSAALIVAWVDALADDEEDRVFLCLESGRDGSTAQAVREALASEAGSAPTLVTVNDSEFEPEVTKRLRQLRSRLLVTAFSKLAASDETTQELHKLLNSAPCGVFGLLYGEYVPSQIKRAFVVTTGHQNDRRAIRMANELRQRLGAFPTIGVVEDETGATPGRAGEKYVRAMLHDEALNADDFEVKVTADTRKGRGIKALYEDHDLVVAGVDTSDLLQSLRDSLGDATAVVVKPSRLLSKAAFQERLPRINPADLADLRLSLRMGSIWGPDFIGMLGLASAIASLGLLQNSPAVVIGSMLLAPLMTPMIGLGLALGQASVYLARQCGSSIIKGFLLTLLVSFVVGIITPAGETLPDEVLARGAPNVLDLLIAVFAAAAATLAMARPNISGAIAGVAIATALVPPVCSVGISLSQAEWLNAFGAAALFFTNLIAIIVMSSFTFSVLGVTSERARHHHRRRAVWGRWAFVVVLLALVGPLSERLVEGLEEGKSAPLAHPVTTAVKRAIFSRVSQDEGVEVIFMARPRAENHVMIHLASPDELPESYADELRQIVRDAMEKPDLTVTVVAVQGWWRSDHDVVENASK